MKLDLRKLKRSGKDQSDFFFEYVPEGELIEIPQAKLVEPVKVNGSISLTGEHSCFVEGEVVFGIQGECTRCLKDAQNYYTAQFAEAIEENNEDGYSLKNDTVDLTIIVDDLIMMNAPISFLCDDACKGICARCGVNLNDSECKCKK